MKKKKYEPMEMKTIVLNTPVLLVGSEPEQGGTSDDPAGGEGD